jgi:hypothetical protein
MLAEVTVAVVERENDRLGWSRLVTPSDRFEFGKRYRRVAMGGKPVDLCCELGWFDREGPTDRVIGARARTNVMIHEYRNRLTIGFRLWCVYNRRRVPSRSGRILEELKRVVRGIGKERLGWVTYDSS